ncbi:YczE/YyaS/YitT family protein [Methanobrevibacter sp.]|uniref:YczE/YyaS/YitT family protein n=1 Tax=Methanobrevibacter sp. TaxID=66852 RepID=UPI00388E5F30
MNVSIKKVNRYVIYLISLFIISLGASLSIKANLGTSPLICIPYVSSLITNLSVGTTSFFFNIFLIAIEIVLLRGGFEKRQYLQIVIGTIFSVFIDFTLMLINFLNPSDYPSQFALLLASCIVMAFGVLLEIKTEVVFLPGDGFIVAVSKFLKREFGKIKPYCDVSFVITAAILSFVFLGYLAGVREGTVISAIIIGPIVRIMKRYLERYVDALIEI